MVEEEVRWVMVECVFEVGLKVPLVLDNAEECCLHELGT